MNEKPAILTNRLKKVRTRLGKSQQELAAAAGVARQTVAGIEAGTYSVSLAVALRIARTLGCGVEELFRLEGDRPALAAIPAQGSGSAERVLLARVGDRWIAHDLLGESAAYEALSPADGRRLENGQIAPLDDLDALAGAVLIAGCAPALSLWALSAERWRPGLRVNWLHANSERALAMLARGEVHVAGLHFPDGNAAPARAALGDDFALIELGTWQEGFALAPGDPKGVRGAADLARPDVSLINREAGAGCRTLLDNLLATAGVPETLVRGYQTTASGHLAVARTVAEGRADVGVTVSSVASAFGLAFLPLQPVRYQLAVRRAALDFPPLATLLQTLGHRWVRDAAIRSRRLRSSRVSVHRFVAVKRLDIADLPLMVRRIPAWVVQKLDKSERLQAPARPEGKVHRFG